MKHYKFIKDYASSYVSVIIDEWIKSARNRAIMKSKLIDGLTFEQVAEKYDLSVDYTKRLIYSLEMQVFEHL